MITPAPYETKIQPRKFGFARPLSLGDFYEAWHQITSQKHYPELHPIDVRLVLKKETIRDMANLTGYYEIPKQRDTPVMEDSIIYFSSLDSKVLGKIERRNCDYESRDRLQMLSVFETLGGFFALPFMFASQPIRSLAVSSPFLIADGVRRAYNSSKNVLSIAIGTPYDTGFSIINAKNYIRQLKTREEASERNKNDISNLVEDLIESTRLIVITQGETPTYTQEDIERFQQFVEHIKFIKI